MAVSHKSRLAQAGQAAGGEPGIRNILKVFYGKMATDPLVGFFFTGKNLEHIVEGQAAFLAKNMGLRSSYGGKTPREAHRSLPPILKGHFDRRLVILRETLKEAGLAPEFVDAWVEFEETFRRGIVEPEGPIGERKRYRDE